MKFLFFVEDTKLSGNFTNFCDPSGRQQLRKNKESAESLTGPRDSKTGALLSLGIVRDSSENSSDSNKKTWEKLPQTEL